MTQIFFHKEITCPKCNAEFIAVGNVIGEPMTTGPENVIAKNVEVGSLLTTDGPKEDIRFEVECPGCPNEIKAEVVR